MGIPPSLFFYWIVSLYSLMGSEMIPALQYEGQLIAIKLKVLAF